ncbi:proton pump-interactor BIP103-like [Phragmites australis]|uniref:proton pump-interactor BIP103-like n=1 Tax=Phragmites australis TaxID=29695 RepID=UPI002D78FEE0|nr:proton pump-interactor BIP103-like [Phragmites australis]
MGMEVVGAEAAPAQVKVSDGEVNLFQEKESKETAKEREEAAVFGSDTNGATNAADLAPPKDAKDEWPEPKQTHAFYFVKIRSFEDPKLRAKLEQADKEFQKKIQVRSKIIEAVRAKKAERSSIILELKPLTAENKQYNGVFNEKLKEMEPLRSSLGKFRDENNAMRAQSAGLCSSIEELEETIKMLNNRIVHESISLAEEKRLVKEIKDLEKTRSKVVSNAANRAKLQDTVIEKEAIQDQVKIIGEGIEGIKKERQTVRSKIKVLEDELKAVDAEIASLQEDLDAATARKDKTYESLVELRQERDVKNASFHQNRMALNKARDYSLRNMLAELQELHKTEVGKFMTQWCENKVFREDYEKRVLSSLNSRLLSRDGRMRNPDEKPIFIESQATAPPAEHEPIPVKLPAKQAKEVPATQADEAPRVEAHSKGPVKSLKAKAALDADDEYEAEPPKEKPKPKEADLARLKEIKRQEEIEKNRLALERKKKQAEKQAAKAAARAQKDAEKKLKKEEKKAKKKAGGADTDEPSESDAKSEEAAEAQAEDEAAPASTMVKKEQKESIRYRNVVSRSKAPPPKAILKRKKAQSYWSWAGPAAAVAAVLLALLAVLGYYQYYLPGSASN